jgi:hypothetical protein
LQKDRLRAVFLFGLQLFRPPTSAEVNETFVFNGFYALNAARDGNLKDTKLYMTMPLDDLWKLHEKVISALTSRVEAQKLELEKDWSNSQLDLGAQQRIFLRHGRTQKSPQNFEIRNRARKLGLDEASSRIGFSCYWRKVDRWRTVASNNEPPLLRRQSW